MIVLMAVAKGVCAQNLTVLYLYFKTGQFVYKKISPDIYIHEVELLDDQLRKMPCKATVQPLVITPLWMMLTFPRSQTIMLI